MEKNCAKKQNSANSSNQESNHLYYFRNNGGIKDHMVMYVPIDKNHAFKEVKLMMIAIMH